MSHNVEHIKLIRKVEYTFGAMPVIFWYGGNRCFTGRGSHLLALQAARLAQNAQASTARKCVRKHLRVIQAPKRRSVAQLRRTWNNMAHKVIQVCVRVSA